MIIALIAAAALVFLFAYVAYPWLCRRGTSIAEASAALPGDSIVPQSRVGYTLAIAIAAKPHAIWPWIVQMGQGRGGFYTHEWVENLLRADIHNATRIVSELQTLNLGDRMRLTPDPYLGQPGQYLEVVHVEPNHALALRQRLPNGTNGSWAFVLRPDGERSTRPFFRRRGEKPSFFDRLMKPGYYFMDRGMLAGLKRRAERSAQAEKRISMTAFGR
jgi:hypothetical protein